MLPPTSAQLFRRPPQRHCFHWMHCRHIGRQSTKTLGKVSRRGCSSPHHKMFIPQCVVRFIPTQRHTCTRMCPSDDGARIACEIKVQRSGDGRHDAINQVVNANSRRATARTSLAPEMYFGEDIACSRECSREEVPPRQNLPADTQPACSHQKMSSASPR